MSNRWPQVKEILASALDLEPGERRAFVHGACGTDQALLEEVESLLAHHDAADALLEQPPAPGAFALSGSTMVGKFVGAYRIVSETGQGGMAVVYLAERADQAYRKRVAVKMVKPGPNSREIVRRFRNERQTLAALDHPNIVKLLDGGTTDDGWPYLVMDFVEGVPIDQYCDGHCLTIGQRLELFCAVCMAVHHAHLHGIIHRDLKPSNILIGKDGAPRLLDFGIAKLLNPEYAQLVLATTGEWRPMTPEYASPEQVRGEAVAAASDIYSLGILFYELLTGRRPYRATTSSWAEIQRLICETEPPRPSSVVREGPAATEEETLEKTPEEIGQARGTNPQDLRRHLQGDLDTIAMMALRKEPQRRYVSAEAFAEDIRRNLAGLPVMARRSTWWYRGGKFMRRHRESVVAAAMVLGFAAAFSLWQTDKLHRQPAQETVVHTPARPAVAILGFKNLSGRTDTEWLSTAVSEMLATELAAGEKVRTVPGESVARTKMDLNLASADTLAADTLQRVGKNLGSNFVILGSYLDLGKGAGGEVRLDLRLQDAARGETIAAISETGSEGDLAQLVSRSGARLREHLGIGGTSPVETVGILASRPSNPEAMRLYAQGLARLRQFDALAARDLLAHAVAADPSFPLAHSALAKAWQTLGYDAKSVEEGKLALQLAGKLSREDHLLIEARLHEVSGAWPKAIDAYQALFSFFPDNLEYGIGLARAQAYAGKGEDTLATLSAMEQSSPEAKSDPRIDLARAEASSTLSNNKLQRDAGESGARKAGAIGARLLKGRALALQCRALANLGEFDRANQVCEQGRRIYIETSDRAGLARMLHAMAEVPLDQDDLPTAERLYRQALALTQEIGDRRGNGRELGNLALIYHERGDYAAELVTSQEALKNFREAGDKPGIAVVTGNLGGMFHRQGNLPEALKYYSASLATANEVGNKSTAAVNMMNMSEIFTRQGRFTEATEVAQKGLAIQRELGQKYYESDALGYLAEIQHQQGKLEEARRNLMQAVALQGEIGEKGGAAGTYVALARVALDAGQPAEAESRGQQALDAAREVKDPDGQAAAQSVLARAFVEQGKIAEAQANITNALQLSGKSKDVLLTLPIRFDQAYVLAGAHDLNAARRLTLELKGQVHGFGMVGDELNASLALAEFQASTLPPSAAAARFREVETTAERLGFTMVARKAAAATAKLTP
jgi:eukaryotic-like serine/threonine-protein kinase